MTSISTSESLLPAFPPPCIIIVVYVRTPVAARRGVAWRDKSRQQAACVPFIHLPQARTLEIGPHVLDSIMLDSTTFPPCLSPPRSLSSDYNLRTLFRAPTAFRRTSYRNTHPSPNARSPDPPIDWALFGSLDAGARFLIRRKISGKYVMSTAWKPRPVLPITFYAARNCRGSATIFLGYRVSARDSLPYTVERAWGWLVPE